MPNKSKDTKKLTAGEHNLRLLIDNLDEPIWLVDTNYIIVECNKSFKKWVHYFIGIELDKGDHILYNGINKVYQEKFETCYMLAMSGRAFRSVEDVKSDGQVGYTIVAFNPVFDKVSNSVIAVSCFARDITEQRKHLFKIEEQNTALKEIAFIESHKVRGPLANMLGLEQLFNYNDLTDPVNKEVMKHITELSKELDTIIREVVRKSNDIALEH